MNFLITSFEDVHDHSAAVDGWNQTYRQMMPGAFRSRLVQAREANFFFFRETMNRRVIEQGVSPPGYASLAVPLYAPITGTFQGQPVNGYAFLALGANEEFRFHTQDVMDFIGVSLPVSEMEELVAAVAGDACARGLARSVLPIRSEHGERLRNQIAPYLERAERTPALGCNAVAGKVFRDEIVSALLDLLAGASPEPVNDLTHRTYSDIVRLSERIVRNREGDEPVTVLDLCRALRCSRRTLQTSFQRVANVTPVAYLRAYRLNAVRELLRSTSPEALSIGDAASRWGFIHLGYFAQEYRTLFNEMPSHTRRLS
ncbi:helix-turn-helix domain-containing protein [Trinickia caryophylli]|uniref:Transcriptional regulator, AraC family n=1 Tax=Trinickia caryophylli TaxID=28094 RepID=A0A1X7GUD9_TRICW|nr:helix-turn-helix domain-containing protein [Trinickia caryophylli]PMS09416.1 AraC family transcriptional regulator [Trinickia caryophylli]TRX18124.1 helix-turn-helix domain-containing protein [Trinickia caryophylli]WQE11093.1 helix-turn-helix domain-containing protein [Trinickia caryophylli]SMF74611.1 transcriptional regulator, AraC family [Trinickia caryophylli]GLU35249.1 AraC family transcriptional regulator [Trinickia caryophylli]